MLNIWSLNSENAQQSLKAHTREVMQLVYHSYRVPCSLSIKMGLTSTLK